MSTEAEKLGIGIYKPSDVASLTGLNADRVRRWVRGYEFKLRDGQPSASPPIFQSGMIRGGDALTFLDLVEVLFVKTFLNHGVSLHVIRRAAEEGSKLYGGLDHPFCIKRFETDGQSIFARLVEEADTDEERHHLLDLARSQYVFVEVFNPLLKQLDYDLQTEAAERWWPRGKDVPIVLDPARSFGKPITAVSSVPTRVLAARVAAGDSVDSVAEWYGVSADEVNAAVDFEKMVTRRAA